MIDIIYLKLHDFELCGHNLNMLYRIEHRQMYLKYIGDMMGLHRQIHI